MKKLVGVSGGQGFVGTYICGELLSKGYKVISIDNYSKYGRVSRPHDNHENFSLIEMDLSKKKFPNKPFEYIIAGAAAVGGIQYFCKYPYKIMQNNERILANTFDRAIELWKKGKLKRIVYISSSMVYEGADSEYEKLDNLASTSCCGPGNFPVVPQDKIWPTKEGQEKEFPPPFSVYGAQKLIGEYWCQAAYEQYGLPYTIIRPFNCVGVYENELVGEERVKSGNILMFMSHCIPDLINKCLRGQDPLRILGSGNQRRNFTHGKDLARGIRLAIESDKAINEAFNISSSRNISIVELAKIIWKEVNGDKPFRYETEEGYPFDVERREPSIDKAREVLGFEAKISLEESVREVVKEMRTAQNK